MSTVNALLAQPVTAWQLATRAMLPVMLGA